MAYVCVAYGSIHESLIGNKGEAYNRNAWRLGIMPLDVTDGNPITVTGTTATDQEIRGDFVSLKFVYWYNPTTAGHLCNLVDSNGDIIIPMRAVTDNDTQMWPIFRRCEGIHCDDMDSGTLLLYLR
jgi:hypothetical protein